MRYSFLFIFILSPNIYVFSQNSIELNKIKEVTTIIEKESEYICLKLDSFNIQMVFYNRINEYFSFEETENRDYINIGRIIPFDSLIGLKQLNYTGSFDYIYSKSLIYRESRYIVISFVDANIYGTNQEVNFVIIKEAEDKKKSIISCYTNKNDKPTEDIKIIYKGHYIKLRGKYLKKMNRKSVIVGHG